MQISEYVTTPPLSPIDIHPQVQFPTQTQLCVAGLNFKPEPATKDREGKGSKKKREETKSAD